MASSEMRRPAVDVLGVTAVLFQEVVTKSYMSRVEAFATGIKIESSDQSSFGGLIKGLRWPPSC